MPNMHPCQQANKMKAIIIALIVCSTLFSCKKDTAQSGSEDNAENWEIVQNFPQDKTYEINSLAGNNNEIFFASSGHRITNNSSNFNNQFQGSFFYKLSSGWMVNQINNIAPVIIKEWNGVLYGIREKRVIRTTIPVVDWEHTYYLFKWENGNYTNLDTLEYTNPNLINKASLGTFSLWVNQNKLHLVSNTNSVLIWEVVNNQLVKKAEELSVQPNSLVATDNTDISFTRVRQLIISPTRTRYVITGFYYNGSAFSEGKTYEFIVEEDTGFSNKEASAYMAVKGNVWGIGFQGNKLKNLDNNAVLSGLSSGKIFRPSPIVSSNGKIYIMLGEEKAPESCAGLAVFDGVNFKQMGFKLPPMLDPCSILSAATEYNGKTYLLLLNRGQYVIVKSK